MKPTNSKERRSALLRFVGIFALAMIPILFGVYRFARIDSAELKEVRRQVASAGEERKESDELTQKLVEIDNGIGEITKQVGKAANNPVIDQSGEINLKLINLSMKLQELEAMETSATTYSLISSTQQLREEMSNLNMNVYKDLVGRIEGLRRDLSLSQEALIECKARQ